MVISSADKILIMILGCFMPAKGAHDTVKSATSITDEPSVQVL